MCQHTEAKTFEAIICAIPSILADAHSSTDHLTQLTWVPQKFTHRCNSVNVDLANPTPPHYLAFVDVHFENGGPVYTPASQHCFTTRKPLQHFKWPNPITPHNKCCSTTLPHETLRGKARLSG